MLKVKGFVGVLESLYEHLLNHMLMVLIVLSFLIRAFFVLLFGPNQNGYESQVVAVNLLNGNGFSYSAFPPVTTTQETCFVAPFYPYLLFAVYRIFGVNAISIFVLQIAQSVIGTITVYVTYRFAQEMFSKRIGMLSGVLVGFYPDFIYSAVIIYPLIFSTLMVTLIAYLFWRLTINLKAKIAVITGIVCGISLLIDPVILAIIGVLFTWASLKIIVQNNIHMHQPKLKRKAVLLGLVVIMCAITVLPWECRCLNVQNDRFVFLKDMGFNLWRGNNPSYTEIGIPSWYEPEIAVSFNSSNEGVIDSCFQDLAFQYIRTYIPESILNAFGKIVDFWWFPKANPEQSPLLRQLTYLPLLGLALTAPFNKHSRKEYLLMLALALLSFSLVYSLAFVLPRYRVPVQPLLFIMSALGLETVVYRTPRNLMPK